MMIRMRRSESMKISELIGTYGFTKGKAIEAMEKQIAKEPICETVDENEIEYEFEHYICPNCKNILHQRYKKSKEPMKYKQNYCHDCGQKLKWD